MTLLHGDDIIMGKRQPCCWLAHSLPVPPPSPSASPRCLVSTLRPPVQSRGLGSRVKWPSSRLLERSPQLYAGSSSAPPGNRRSPPLPKGAILTVRGECVCVLEGRERGAHCKMPLGARDAFGSPVPRGKPASAADDRGKRGLEKEQWPLVPQIREMLPNPFASTKRCLHYPNIRRGIDY